MTPLKLGLSARLMGQRYEASTPRSAVRRGSTVPVQGSQPPRASLGTKPAGLLRLAAPPRKHARDLVVSPGATDLASAPVVAVWRSKVLNTPASTCPQLGELRTPLFAPVPDHWNVSATTHQAFPGLATWYTFMKPSSASVESWSPSRSTAPNSMRVVAWPWLPKVVLVIVMPPI